MMSLSFSGRMCRNNPGESVPSAESWVPASETLKGVGLGWGPGSCMVAQHGRPALGGSEAVGNERAQEVSPCTWPPPRTEPQCRVPLSVLEHIAFVPS